MKQGTNNKSKATQCLTLNEMQKEQLAFRSFMSSLKTQKHAMFDNTPLHPKSFYNFKESFLKGSQSQFVSSQVKFQGPMNNLPSSQKIKLIQKIKNSQDFTPLNFRISKVRSVEKPQESLKTHSKLNFSLVKTTRQKIETQGKKAQAKSFALNNNEIQDKADMYSKRYQQKLSNIPKQSKLSKLKLESITNVTWNPRQNQIEIKQFHQQCSINREIQSRFLLEIINMQVSKTLTFLKSQNLSFLSFNQIQGSKICSIFQTLFQTHKFSNIKEPSVKKYNNCIFYGQKQNFNQDHSGVILYFNRNAYFGQLKNFQKHGLGIDFIHSKNLTDNVYQPQDSNSEQDFYIIFRGNYYKNSKTGQFLINAPNYCYQGSLVKGFFEGQGTLITENSNFKGEWSLNKKISGLQILKKQQIVYEGEYKNGKFHGKGKLKSHHQFYQGQFSNGLKSGIGILVNQQFIYEGQFSNGKKHGKGVYFDKDQQKVLNPENKSSNFEEFIYSVEFSENQLIQKAKLKQLDPQVQQHSLATLEQAKSIQQTLTIDFQNVRPSKFLLGVSKDKIPQKKQDSTQNNYSFQKLEKIKKFVVFPAEPEEERLYIGKNTSYLLGNQGYRSNRIKKSFQ